MNIEGSNLCIGCMKPLGQTGRCSFCGMKQEDYNPIPRCLLPGTRLADRYILGKVLGEGSFGITYIGWDSRLQIPVAIKEYFPSEMVSRDVICGHGNKVYLYENAKKNHYEEDIKKFLNEAKCLSKFNEVEGIVSVLDFFYENETAYIVMQFIDGVSVKEYIKKNGKMDGKKVLNAMWPVLLALEKVTGIVHRDIRPDNIMIRKDGSLVLIDFGAARMRNIDNTKTMTVLFKRGFSPEEQYRYKGRWGAYTDVYSISATMYYMLTGEAPTDSVIRALGDDMPSLLNMKELEISTKQKKAVMKGMAVNAKNRWQSIRELYDAMYEEEQNITSGSGRRRGIAGIAGAAVLGTAITIGCLHAGTKDEKREPVIAVETPVVTPEATKTPKKEILMTNVTGKTMAEAEKDVPIELKAAIMLAQKNIHAFHAAQRFEGKKVQTVPGVTCWQKAVAIEKVGLYIPGGTAPLFSTVLMLATPAQIAGCKEIVLCTPPDKAGKIHPAILYAAKLAGVNKIFKAGGVQAIGAMAYGTESVPKVYKIFGPGNQYVTAAKQQVSLCDVAIDMPAGPSEVEVLADETANPVFVAADLLSQAEHGVDSQAMLVTTSEKLMEEVEYEVQRQLALLSRWEIAEKSLANSKLILVKDMDEAIALTNEYAPEHLIIETRDYEEQAERIVNAGSVFLGSLSPESAGDYASGTNHTLPTNGYAKAYGGVSLDSFIRKITFQEITREGIEIIGPAIEVMAANEQLSAHKNAVTVRLKAK